MTGAQRTRSSEVRRAIAQGHALQQHIERTIGRVEVASFVITQYGAQLTLIDTIEQRSACASFEPLHPLLRVTFEGPRPTASPNAERQAEETFLDQAARDARDIAFWSARLGRSLTAEDVREIRENLVGFFRLLIEWRADLEAHDRTRVAPSEPHAHDAPPRGRKHSL